jgi:hypothetical protein
MPTAPITIQADHDGKATIDGAGSAPYVIEENDNSYVVVAGLLARNAGPNNDVLIVSGQSDMITLRIWQRRVSFYSSQFSFQRGRS